MKIGKELTSFQVAFSLTGYEYMCDKILWPLAGEGSFGYGKKLFAKVVCMYVLIEALEYLMQFELISFEHVKGCIPVACIFPLIWTH